MNSKERFKLFLLDRVQQFSTPHDQYRWVNEQTRWWELVFCILVRLNSSVLDATELRQIVAALGDLGYLDIPTLARLCDEKGELRENEMAAAVILDTFIRAGVSFEQAKLTVCTLSEAAGSIHKNFGGKVQKYLRKYGQQMVAEVRSNFTFTKLDDDDLAFVFRHWLQNVVYLPVQLSFKDYVGLEDFKDLTLGDMIEAADELDINLALVDDILSYYKSGHSGPSSPES